MGSKTIRCPRCQTRKPRTAFYPDKHRKIGVAVYCKICSREVSRISNSKHKKEIAKRSKKWRETHPERIRQLSREWHRRNPSKRKQYNIIKCQYLDSTWNDETDRLAHGMFQCLTNFVEKEMDIIDWDYNDEHRHAKSEIMSLYHWWHDNYNKSYIEDGLKLWTKMHKYMPEITWEPSDHPHLVKMVTTWKNPDDEKKYHKLIDESIALDAKHEAELKANMIRLINIKEYLWS